MIVIFDNRLLDRSQIGRFAVRSTSSFYHLNFRLDRVERDITLYFDITDRHYTSMT